MRMLPEIIINVSQTPIRVCRNCGTATFNGQSYVHDAKNDRLIRSDVFRQMQRKEAETISTHGEGNEINPAHKIETTPAIRA